MKRKILFFILCLLFFFFFFGEKAKAAVECSFSTVPQTPIVGPIDQIQLKFDTAIISQELKNYPSGGTLKYSYASALCRKKEIPYSPSSLPNPLSDTIIRGSGGIFATCDNYLLGSSDNDKKIDIIYEYGGNTVTICSAGYKIEESKPTCNVRAEYSGLGDVDDSTWKIVVSDIVVKNAYYTNGVSVLFDEEQIHGQTIPSSGIITINIPQSFRTANTAHGIIVYNATCISDPATGLGECIPKNVQMCSTSFEIAPAGATPKPTVATAILIPTPAICNQCAANNDCSGPCYVCPGCPGDPNKPVPVAQLKPICDQLDTQFVTQCWNCMTDGKHTWTAIGCIPNDFSIFIKDYVFVAGISIAGGVAFLYFLYGAFLILTSAGNAEMIEQAKQIIVSALSGLLLIIFSVFLLRVIGVDVLKLPGFS